MEEIHKALFSPLWWFTAIFAGVIASLFASYLRTPIDNFLSRISLRWQKRTTKKKEEFEALVQELRGDTTRQIFAAIDEVGHILKALTGLLTIFMLLAFTVFLDFQRMSVLNEALKKPSGDSLTSLSPPLSPSDYLIPEILALFLIIIFAFFVLRPSTDKAARLRLALEEARKAPTPDKEQADTKILPAGDE